jgi:hypothetical protein
MAMRIFVLLLFVQNTIYKSYSFYPLPFARTRIVLVILSIFLIHSLSLALSLSLCFAAAVCNFRKYASCEFSRCRRMCTVPCRL